MLSSLDVAAAMPSRVQTRILGEDVETIDYDLYADSGAPERSEQNSIRTSARENPRRAVRHLRLFGLHCVTKCNI